MLRIGSDLDDSVNFWYDEYLKRFGQPKNDYIITKHVMRILRHDRNWWLNLPLKHCPDFTPTLYCTARLIPKSWTKRWLIDHDVPLAPIYQKYGYAGSKAPLIKGRVDVFVEDSLKNFIDLNLQGIPCLLIDSPANQSWGPIGRIYSLNYDEIEDTYHLFKETIFNDFKQLL